MYKIKILAIGKPKEAWLKQAVELYLKRLQSVAHVEFIFAKNDKQLLDFVEKENEVIPLDPQGILLTSEAFSQQLVQTVVTGGSRLAFVIGGAEGLPHSLKKHKKCLSLSTLTFTHQLTQLILVEQIYRALEIAKGSPYHK